MCIRDRVWDPALGTALVPPVWGAGVATPAVGPACGAVVAVPATGPTCGTVVAPVSGTVPFWGTVVWVPVWGVPSAPAAASRAGSGWSVGVFQPLGGADILPLYVNRTSPLTSSPSEATVR